ncbi:hypothetical protein [Legionella clemsonensis]|uniref:Uncharacterized protein n=1 Tax=Legionella clemsonensis TaxID=1867846 RepID=A0A222P6G2_9GAMM|nr:hypothetical protein [Legionella clemsonensis]ASQ47454.1 hypothetical protein clem_14645 [Legionella clemsonensis]
MDASKRSNRLKNLNKYSWFILITFIFAVFAMSYQTTNASLDGFIQTLPLIIFAFWSEKSARLIKQAEANLKKVELFNRDTFLLSVSFYSDVLFHYYLLMIIVMPKVGGY